MMELSDIERRAGRARAEVAKSADKKIVEYCMLMKLGVLLDFLMR